MRSRTIKPGFFSDEGVADCTPLARILFAGLWCMADRDGKLHDKPRQIKAEVLPYEAIPDADALLQELAAKGLVVRYEVAGVRYLKLPGFTKHQNPHPKEKPSEIPEPDLSAARPDLSAASPGVSGTSRAVSVPSVSTPSHSSAPRNNAARVGVGSPAFPAVEHWTKTVWPRLSEALCPSVTTVQEQSLRVLCERHGPAVICAAMDAAAVDEFWGAKLDLDTFISRNAKWLGRKATGPLKRGMAEVGQDFSKTLEDVLKEAG